MSHFERTGVIGSWDRLWAAGDLAVAQQNGGLSSYDSSGELIGSLDDLGEGVQRECEVVVRPPDGDPSRPVAFWMESTEIPAQGLQDARVQYDLTAHTADLEEVWRVPLGSTDDSAFNSWCDANSTTMRLTSDASFLAIDVTQDHDFVVDLDSRKVSRVTWTPEPVGRYLAKLDGTCANCLNNLGAVEIVDPATLRTVSTFSGDPGDDSSPRSLALEAATSDGDAVVDGGAAVVMMSGGSIHVLRLAEGKVQQRGVVTVPEQTEFPQTSGEVHMVGDDSAVILPQWIASTSGTAGTILQGWRLTAKAPTWKADDVTSICAVEDEQTVVEANGQLVLLDSSTGEQLDYTDAISCQGVVSDGLLWADDPDGTVYALTDHPGNR